jgi:hypothetical protein
VRSLGLAVVAALASTLGPAHAWGHDPLGRAQPVLFVAVTGIGSSQRVKVGIKDMDSEAPIRTARISATAARLTGTGQPTPPQLKLTVVKLSQVRYVVRLRTLSTGTWRVSLKVFGMNVVKTELGVDVDRSPSAAAMH